ncbi:hypothetical protein HGRIS_003338 [Hohenbuehelia grisea]|uniref:MICOS complex subunit MIC60 n=1 Tax=Hohenbuehelia grisea TaxID=104357 RepID=A0ABR3JF38_9AGAR
MYRSLLATNRVASSATRGILRATRRRLATDAAPPKKKRGVVSRIFWYTAGLTGTFYIGSTFLSFKNQTYYDFFSDTVPLGQSFLEYGEANGWDTLTLQQVLDKSKESFDSAQRLITNTINGTPDKTHEAADKVRHATENVRHKVEQKAHDAKVAATEIIHESKERVQEAASRLKTQVQKEEDTVLGKTAAIARHQSQQVADELTNLIRQAENALSDKPVDHLPEATTTPEQPAGSPPDATPPRDNDTDQPITDKTVYTAPLPLGFEPPPGYTRPAPPKKSAPKPKAETTPVPPPAPKPLPLVAPAVAELSVSEPVIWHLASTIDGLASYLSSNPAAAEHAADVLESAKSDLTALVDHIERVKADERATLEQQLDETAREYSVKLMELEMAAQDKLDSQEEAFRQFYDQEKIKFAEGYREKLAQELQTQTELINERLKQEVIAQGIELQRRWIREIKVRVEQERGGRLAKLDELSAGLKRLERIALDNSAFLDENIRVHALWSALRAVTGTLNQPVRAPFREELRVLRHVGAAREDPVIAAVLEGLEASDVPDVGIEPLADLTSWFTTSVAPRVSVVALVPDQNAGLLAHLASHLFSTFRFKRQGLVEGNDALSVLARAEYYLNEKDLDSAARELNQLQGTAKVLLHDWLEAARRRLEVQQALEVIQAQATLASLLVI